MQSKRDLFLKGWKKRSGSKPHPDKADDGDSSSNGDAKPTIARLAISTLRSSPQSLNLHDRSSPTPAESSTPNLSRASTRASDLSLVSKGPETLSSQAYTFLSKTDSKLIEGYTSITRMDPGDRGQVCQHQKPGGKKITEAFKKVKDFGAAVASLDPIHAGLPWAGVSFLLGSIADGILKLISLQLLYQQSGRKQNEENGIQIVKRLGYPALAISQASTYIKSLKLDFSAFESHYSSQRRESILKYEIPMNKYTKSMNETERETAFNVFTTWELSFNELRTEKHPAALENLMTLFAFFDPADISEDLFSDYVRSHDHINTESGESELEESHYRKTTPFEDFGLLGESLMFFLGQGGVWNSEAFADALQVLDRLSLIQSFHRTNDFCYISLHPLVKDWIRLRTDSEVCESCTILGACMIEAYSKKVVVKDAGIFDMAKAQVFFTHTNAFEDNVGCIATPTTAVASTKHYMYERLVSSEIGIFEIFMIIRPTERAGEISRRAFHRQKTIYCDDTSSSSITTRKRMWGLL
ncbi:hypothetical protein DSL72_007879 [Monilinia vaccinii-corymbosi]|uniref:NWD NACHT-NTPase N-terminal domain-containing protein n=1 Tax=Monilinia vaccinii-corymbosi TaxID=61207 RepID=A0A8A3PI60_9HELO|nr:hypothetical protein DSL72_007879 [Monilinia vaccinii-corymbosi]